MQSRIAVLFDSVARPDTIGTYCLRAFQQLASEGRIGTVDQIRPQDSESLKTDQYDLFVWIDDGNRYDIPEYLKPNVFWVIDTHMKPDCSRTDRIVRNNYSEEFEGA